VVRGEALRFVSNVGAPAYDLAILDPPYGFDGWDGLIAALPATVAVLESDREIDPGDGWAVLRSRRYGTTVVTISRRARPRSDNEETSS
jgi:16S rRNA G966 N2-methylase RsmD